MFRQKRLAFLLKFVQAQSFLLGKSDVVLSFNQRIERRVGGLECTQATQTFLLCGLQQTHQGVRALFQERLFSKIAVVGGLVGSRCQHSDCQFEVYHIVICRRNLYTESQAFSGSD
ncbi:hypothetical protein BDZ88DRAFT_430696 [Geranomyces variabilis]|nr:hypothetical protein BDZ88DRAFT_430696 [Geranomyces variabilis]